MQLLASAPATLTETCASVPQSPTSRQPKLSMVWHKEWDGKRERMVAEWVTHP